MDDSPMARRTDVQPMLLDLEEAPPQQKQNADWQNRLFRALANRDSNAAELAESAVRAVPSDYDILLLATIAMLVAKQPDRALVFLKRHQKRWVPGKRTTLLTALAYAEQGQSSRAKAMLEEARLDHFVDAMPYFAAGYAMQDWLSERLMEIRRRGAGVQTRASARVAKPAKPAKPVKPARPAPRSAVARPPPPAPVVPEL